MLKTFLFTLLLVSIMQIFSVWWTLAPAALLISFLFAKSEKEAVLSGFLAVFILWTSLALFRDVANAGIIATRIGALLGVQGLAPFLFLISGFLGGLIGGLASYVGFQLKTVREAKTPPSAHYQHQ